RLLRRAGSGHLELVARSAGQRLERVLHVRVSCDLRAGADQPELSGEMTLDQLPCGGGHSLIAWAGELAIKPSVGNELQQQAQGQPNLVASPVVPSLLSADRVGAFRRRSAALR